MVGREEFECGGIQHDDLALVLEVDRYAIADDRLDLTDAPAGHLRVAHEGADLEKVSHGFRSRR